MKYIVFFALCLGFFYQAYGQPTIIFPEKQGWNVVRENETLSFQVKASGSAHFSIEGADGLGITFDSLGNFAWKPGFDFVDRVALQKDISFIFEARYSDTSSVRKPMTFTVIHVNRPPVVEELPVFYVRQASQNVYQIPTEYVYDPDGDPIVFKSILSQMPEGSTLSSNGQFSWSPSRNQFNAMKTQPYSVDFLVQDQPDKAETQGKLRIAQTQLDLPPELLIVPGDSLFVIKEDEPLNLKIYLSDPNGDDNVRSAGMISGDPKIPQTVLKENTPVQYEFTWTPGYHYTDDAQKFSETEIVFFVLDRTNNRTEKKIKIRVTDAENMVEKDALQFTKYRNSLVGALMLITQLDENQKKLNQEYKKAHKGKKKRSVLNASLGAATGISPVTLEPDQSKVVSGIGGTTVLTLGTLEATEVIGRSKESIMEKIRLTIEIRNKLQSQGDDFSRKYSLKAPRRTLDFEKDIDKLRTAMNDQRLVLLELDAYKKGRARVEDRDIKKVFIDFTEE